MVTAVSYLSCSCTVSEQDEQARYYSSGLVGAVPRNPQSWPLEFIRENKIIIFMSMYDSLMER